MRRTPRGIGAAALLGVAVASLTACGLTQNRIVPLIGEAEAAVRLSGERAVWLERTGATRAVEALREALIRGDAAGALARLGPRTLERLQEARGGRPGEEALLTATGRRSLPPDVAPVVEMITAQGPWKVQEVERWDPSRRHVTVRVSSSLGEVLLPAHFTQENGWRVECLPETSGTRVPSSSEVPGDPG